MRIYKIPKLMLGMFWSVCFTLNWKRRNKFKYSRYMISHIKIIKNYYPLGNISWLCFFFWIMLWNSLKMFKRFCVHIISSVRNVDNMDGNCRFIHMYNSIKDKIKKKKMYSNIENQISGNIKDNKILRTPGERIYDKYFFYRWIKLQRVRTISSFLNIIHSLCNVI